MRACHDLSEGGLAVAVAEMAFAGGCGAQIFLDQVPSDVPVGPLHALTLLFSESNTRFLCEVSPDSLPEFLAAVDGIAYAQIGTVTADRLIVYPSKTEAGAAAVLVADPAELKAAWQAPFKW